jgi:hypothetical protein
VREAHCHELSLAYASLLTHIPYQRIGEPEDIGRVAMTLYPEFSTGS